MTVAFQLYNTGQTGFIEHEEVKIAYYGLITKKKADEFYPKWSAHSFEFTWF